MDRDSDKITIVAVGQDGYEIARLLKKEPFFSDAILIACDVSGKFINRISKKVDKAIVMPDLRRPPLAEDATLAEPIVDASTGRLLVTCALYEIVGKTFAPLIALCALMHRIEVYSSFVIERFWDMERKAMIKLWAASKLAVRMVDKSGREGTDRQIRSFRPLVESTEAVLRLVPPKLSRVHLSAEAIQKYVPKEYSNFVYACHPLCVRQNDLHPNFAAIFNTFNNNPLNKPMNPNFTPKHEADNVDRLINLYGRHWIGLNECMESIANNPDMTKKASLPLLLCPVNDGKDWDKADLKIMVFGRETNNWNIPGKKILQFRSKKFSRYLCRN